MTHKQLPINKQTARERGDGCRTIKREAGTRSSKSAWRDEAGTGKKGGQLEGGGTRWGGVSLFLFCTFLAAYA